MIKSAGFHHVTIMSGNPKDNVAFYNKVLGLRMIKKTVNFDDPTTWHLYYADEKGNPGTVMTVFPFPNSGKGTIGAGQVRELRFAVNAGQLELWHERLQDLNIKTSLFTNFSGERLLKFTDPDGLPLAIKESIAGYTGWSGDGLSENQAIRGFEGMTLWAGRPQPTARTLETLGFTAVSANRYLTSDHQTIDIEPATSSQMGRGGAGTVHHIAFRAKDDKAQEELSMRLKKLGLQVTDQVDRQYFRSIYFREPSGVLYEIATDQPGFLVDESLEMLGQTLQLPPWYEPHRAAITAALAPLE